MELNIEALWYWMTHISLLKSETSTNCSIKWNMRVLFVDINPLTNQIWFDLLDADSFGPTVSHLLL